MKHFKEMLAIMMIFIVLLSTFRALPVSGFLQFCSKEQQGDDPEYSVSNEYLSLYVEYGSSDGIGTACLETSEGYDLLYTSRDHNAWSSYLTVQIDGVNYANAWFSPSLNNYVIQYPTVVGNSIVTKWSVDSVLVEQTIELVGKAAKWMFTITNTGTNSKQVKVRYLFDYQVRDQDGAPICIHGGPILKKETKFEGMEINFDNWFTRDYLDSTYTVQGVHTLETKPYMIIFANWANAHNYLFDYTDFDPDRAFYTPGQIYSPQSDSCALIYWDIGTIHSGDSRIITTYYGVGGPIPSGVELVKYAFNELESYVKSKIENSYYTYAQAISKGYKKWGDWFKDNIISYYGYRAGLLSEDRIDGDVKKWAENTIGELINENISRIDYDTLCEMFGKVNLSMTENEVTQTIFNYLLEKAEPAINYFNQKFTELRDKIIEELMLIQNELSEEDFSFIAKTIMSLKELVPYPRQHETFLEIIKKAVNEEISGEFSISLIGQQGSLVGLAIALIIIGAFAVGGVAGYYVQKSIGPGAVATRTCSTVVGPSDPELAKKCKCIGTISGLVASEITGKSIASGICIATAEAPLIGIPFCVGFFVGSTIATIEGLYSCWSGSSINSYRIKEFVRNQTNASLQVLEHTVSDIEEPSDSSGNIGIGEGRIRVKNVGTVPLSVMLGPKDIIIEGAIIQTSVISLPDKLMPGEEKTIRYNFSVNLASIASGSCAFYQSKVTLRSSYIKKITTWSNFFKVCNMRNPQESQAVQMVSMETVARGNLIEGQTFTTSFITEPNSRRCVFSLSYAGSDLDLHLYDEYGNHIGLNYFTGEVENQIEGSWYSGPNTYPEWIQVSKDVSSRIFTIKITAVTTDEIGADFAISVREVPDVPPIMRLSPKHIELDLEPGEFQQIPICISETGGMSKLMNTTLEATDLIYNGQKINNSNIQFADNHFDIEAVSSFFTAVRISIPQDATGGRYTGKIVAVAGGDVRDECTLIVNIPDELPPQTSILIGSPHFEKDGKIYVNVETKFTLEAVDEGFGLLYTLFKIDEGSWINYSSSFTLAGYTDGHHTIYYFSVDKAGNEETTKALSIMLDSASPTTTCNPEGGTFSERITIILSATDSGSGVSKTYYRIGEGEWKEYIGPFNITEPGSYTIYYYSIDNLGNREETKSASFTINQPTFPLFWLAIIITILIAITIGAIALTRRTKKASVVVSKSMSLTINPFL